MAYKFQFGTARLSGALEQEGDITIATGSGDDVIGVESTLGSGNYLAQLGYDGGTDTGKLEIADGSGGTVFSVLDVLSGSAMDTLAGAGLAFDQSTGVMSTDLSELSDNQIASGDSIAYVDFSDSNNMKKDRIDDIATLFAGQGLGASAAVISVANATNGGLQINTNDMQLDLNDLAAAAIDVANDSFAIVDANDNSTKKESIADFVTAMVAGNNGLAASSGVISVQTSGAVNLDGDKVGISGSIAGAGLSYAGGVDAVSSLAVDAAELVSVFGAVTIDVGADSMVILDADGNTVASDSLADYAAAAAGTGIGAASGVFELDVSELSQAAIADGDYIVIEDATDNSTKKESIADVASLFAGYGLSAASSVMALDLNELTQEAIASGDFISFVDSTDNGTHKESIDDIATLFAGNGLSATNAVLAVEVSGAVKIASDKVGISGSIAGDGLSYAGGVDSISSLSLDLNELTDATVQLNQDSFAFIDASDGSTKKERFTDFANLLVGASNSGLQDSSGQILLDLNGLTAATVDVAADSIAIIDANASAGSRKESIADLVSAMAGAGLAASSGVLSVQSNNVAVKANGDNLEEGFNYFADLSADATVTLPTSPDVGDVVRIKARNLTSGANIIINRAGSHTIDGETSIRIESPFGAISMVYVAANDWRLF